MIAAPLMATWGASAIGAMMGIFVLISLVCTSLLPETKGATMRLGGECCGGPDSGVTALQ